MTGVLFVRVICLRIRDIKIIIALSSVGHIGLRAVLLAFSSTYSAVRALVIFLTHGFSSSLIFLVAYLVYLRRNSRSLIITQRVLRSRPILVLIVFMACLGVIGAPPIRTLWGELLSFRALAASWPPRVVLLTLRALFRGAYVISFYSRTCHSRRSYFCTRASVSYAELLTGGHLLGVLVLFRGALSSIFC